LWLLPDLLASNAALPLRRGTVQGHAKPILIGSAADADCGLAAASPAAASRTVIQWRDFGHLLPPTNFARS